MNAACVSSNSGSFHLGFDNELVTRFADGALRRQLVCFRRVCATRVVPPSKAFRDSRTISATPCVLRKKEIHSISDAIAKLMADDPHTIQPGYKVVAAVGG